MVIQSELPVRVARTLAIASLGTALGYLLNLPAPALVGSTLAVALAAMRRVAEPPPPGLGNLAFAVIGCALGSTLSEDFVSALLRWLPSLALLSVCLILIVGCSTWLLVRGFGYSTYTAGLAAAPGALSYIAALVATGHGDGRAVMILQTLRMVAVTVSLPLFLSLNGQVELPTSASPAVFMDHAIALVMVLTAAIVGELGAKLAVPAAAFVAGMILSGALHASGLLIGQLPTSYVVIGLTVTGAMIGARFSTFTPSELRSMLWAAVCVIFTGLSISAVFGMLAWWWLGIPIGQAWIAYAPGGLEAMVAVALALDYQPAFVATHHFVRMLLLITLMPVLAGFGSGSGRHGSP